MRTLSQLLNSFTTQSNNTSAANQSIGLELLTDRQRYLLENYFDNETSFSTATIGAMNLSLTALPAAGATSATLTSAWQYASGQQQVYLVNAIAQPALAVPLAAGVISGVLSVAWPYSTQTLSTTFTDGEVKNILYTNLSTAVSWSGGLSNNVSTALTVTLPPADSPTAQFTNGSTAITWQEPLNSYVTSVNFSTGGFQKYRIPANVSKITNNTITVGTLKFVPAPVMTRTEWDRLNFLPYPSDIPNYFFIYNGYVEFWPTPSTTGNKVTFNYKARVPDFSTAFLFSSAIGAQYVAGQPTFDYQQGTITSASVDGITITGTGTKWVTAQGATGGLGMGTGLDATQFNLYLMVQPPAGDGIWYQIQQFTDDTHLVLSTPLMNTTNISNAVYSIAQLPILSEDFQDALVYGSLLQYYTNIVPDPNKYKANKEEYDSRLGLLADYAGEKSISYNLGEKPVLLNPNSYPYYPTNYN